MFEKISQNFFLNENQSDALYIQCMKTDSGFFTFSCKAEVWHFAKKNLTDLVLSKKIVRPN